MRLLCSWPGLLRALATFFSLACPRVQLCSSALRLTLAQYDCIQMVPFAGYSLPVQFKEGVLQSHLHTRADDSASLFDVGHMGQIRWHGKDAVKFLETLVVGDLASLKTVRCIVVPSYRVLACVSDAVRVCQCLHPSHPSRPAHSFANVYTFFCVNVRLRVRECCFVDSLKPP